MNDRPTYPELLKLFYKHSFPDQLGAVASSVAQAIIYKANDLYFPADWQMSNVELSHLSGVDVSNIGRSRQKVCEICKVDGIPLFTYVGNDKRKAGKYIINYSLPSRWRQDSVKVTSSSRQKDPEIDNDPNLTLPNETKQTKQEQFSPLAGDSEKPEADQFISLLMLRFKLPTMPAYGMVNNMIHKYTLEACVAAMESSKPTSNTWSGILAYISKVAAGISAQSRGVSGEKLDNMEKEYQKLYYEIEESQAAVDRDKDTMDAGVLKEAESWLDRNESQLAMMAHTIEENGGSLEVRR